MNKKIAISIFLLAILILSFPIIFLSPVRAAASVTLLSSSGWADLTNVYHITGEVQNTGSGTVALVVVLATFFDANNNMLDSQFTYASLNYLQPNAKSPFSIIEWQSTIVSKIDHYKLQVSFSPSSIVSPALQILSSNLYGDTTGVHVIGEIQNLGTAKSTGTEVYATFYDANGKVVDIAFSLASPDIIASGGISSFDVPCKDSTQLPLISNYSLTAESKEFELILTGLSPNATLAPTSTSPSPTQKPSTNPSPTIPEFPISLTLLLIILFTSGSSIILKLRKR